MINLDTIMILIDLDVIDYIDYLLFELNLRYDNVYDDKNDDIKQELIKETLSLKDDYKGKGLNILTIDKSEKKCRIEISAKILEIDYLEGININTIDKALHNIKKRLWGLRFDTDKVINNAYVLRCDVTDNLYLADYVSKYIEALKQYCINSKYRLDVYGNYGIVATKLVKSYKERLILYDKIAEMAKKDKKLLLLLDCNNKIKCPNIGRVESNFTSFERMRKYFNIDKDDCDEKGGVRYIKLIDVLQSKERVNYKLMKQITDMKLPATIDKDYNNMKFNEIEKLVGRQTIVKDCNYDIELIKSFIKKHVKGNISKYVSQYRQLIKKISHDEQAKSNETNSSVYIDELLRLLAG